MKPVKYDLEIWQGKTFEKPFWFKDRLDNVTELQGYTARMQLRVSIESTEVAAELTTENGGIIIDAALGKVTMFLTDEQTEVLAVGSYKYDLELVTAGGRVYGPLYGKIKVKGEVTRDA